MRRHWRKSATAMAATALVVTAASTAFATTEPPGTEPAGTEAAGGGTGYDESATCGTDAQHRATSPSSRHRTRRRSC